MKNRKSWLFLLMAIVLVLAACGGDTSDENETSGNDVTKESELVVEVVAKGFQHDFWKAVESGAKQAAEEHSATMNFVGPSDETAIAEQLEMLNNAINKNPSAIALAALDTSAQLDAIEQAKNKNIPIIGFDSGVPGAPEGAVKATASTDNYKAGGTAAEHGYQAIQDRIAKGEVIRIGVISQEVNSLSISQRTEGFIDKMVELLEADEHLEAGKIAVIGHDKFANDVDEGSAQAVIELRVPAEVTDAAGRTEAHTLLEKQDKILIHGTNEFAAKAIINANDGLGNRIGAENDKVIAIGFDSGALQQNAVRNGQFLGSITQNPVKIGYEAVSLAIRAAQGESVTDVDTGAEWYTQENIDTEDMQALLYE